MGSALDGYVFVSLPGCLFPLALFYSSLLLLSSPPSSSPFSLQVYIQGTFNNWERQIPMHRSGNDFTYIHNLKRGKHVRSGGLGRGGGEGGGYRRAAGRDHCYSTYCADEGDGLSSMPCCAPPSPSLLPSLPPSLPSRQAFKFIVDDEWRFAPDQLTVADVEGRINNFIDVTHFKPFNEDSSTLDIARKEEELYGTTYPDVEEYSVKEPPPLPPHLRHIILNKVRRM